MQPLPRQRLLQVHRWSGLTLGLLLLFLAITGLGLQFRHQLHGLAEPAALSLPGCPQPLPLDNQIAAARAAHASGKYDTVVLARDSATATLVRFTDDAALFVDPCSGRVVHEQARWGGLFGRLEQLHRFRFLDDNDLANFFTGSAAMGLAVLLVGIGLALWWSARGRSAAAAASLRPHLRGRALDLNVHKVFGVWASIVLLGVTLTSLPLAFKWTRTVINTVVGSAEPAPKPKSQPAAADAKPLKMGVQWERAQALFDQPSRAVLAFPKKKGDAVEIYALERGAPHAEARSYVWLDAYSGAVLRAEPYASSTLGNRIYRTAAAIHSGEYGLLLQVLEFLGTLALPVLAFTGLRSWLRGRRRAPGVTPAGELQVRIASAQEAAAGIKCFELVAADGGPLPPFEAGAHVDVRLRDGLIRSYSICSDPQDRSRYVIAVKRARPSRGGSEAMHALQGGEVLTVGMPRNNFPLDPRAEHHLLVAAGIGVTPLLAMATELRRSGRPFALHYFTHSVAHTAFDEELSQAGFHGKVHVHAGLPRHLLAARLGDLLRHHRPGDHLYLCGPEGFMDAALARARTWPQDSIHMERFHANRAALERPREAFQVRLARSRRTLQVGANESIAEALYSNGFRPPTSCQEGVCGSCMTRVVAGECDHRDGYLSPAERAAGDRIMLCVSRARGSELVLDL